MRPTPPWLQPGPTGQHPDVSRPPRLAGQGSCSQVAPVQPGSSRHTGNQPPLWELLQAAVDKAGYLLHGSQTRGLTRLHPRTPIDHSPDAFSKQNAVFASSDAIWAMCYALRGADVQAMMNFCVEIYHDDVPSPAHYFLSLAGPRPGPELLSPGWVYILQPEGFTRMEPYHWPSVGFVREAQWSSLSPAPVVDAFAVTGEDLPIQVHSHDDDRVAQRSAQDPEGFPWWD